MTLGKVVSITTDGTGVGSVDVRLYGRIVGLGIRLGTLSTPDFTISDYLTATTIYAAAGVAADKHVQPRLLVQDAAGADIADAYDEVVITGVLRIAVTGGGATKTGQVVIVYE